MKKLIVAICAVALMAGAVSCKKDEVEPVISVPVYTEGIYQPLQQIEAILEDGVQVQEWVWNGKNLDHVTMADGSSMTYNYSGNYISKVTTTGEKSEELRYYYTDNLFSKCELYYNNVLAVTMDILHNANGKVSSATITIDDSFLLTLAGGLLGGNSMFEKLLGRQTAESMIRMAQVAQYDNSKFTVSNKTVTMNLEWNGENLDKQIVSANVTVNLDTNDLNLLSMFIEIPEEYLSFVQMAMALGGGVPLSMTVSDTISSTYDTMYNPMFCNWGTIFSAENLSMNNVLTTTHNGSFNLTVSLLGQSMQLLNQPIEDYYEYQYEYGNHKYPVKVSGDRELAYTYKQQ